MDRVSNVEIEIRENQRNFLIDLIIYVKKILKVKKNEIAESL